MAYTFYPINVNLIIQSTMKNFFLLLSFFALAISSAQAQSMRSAKLQEYSRQLSPSINQTMLKAGLDIAAAPPTTTHNNRLQLDSTKTFYAYDPTGSLDSTPLFRTIYEYPQPGVKVEQEYQFDGSDWEPIYRSTYRYDDLERLTEVFAEYYDPETNLFMPDSRLEAYPRGTSLVLLDSFIVYGWAPETSDWHAIIINYNVFEAADRLVETISVINLFGEPILFKDVLLYDANGDNYLTETYIVEAGVDIMAGKTETEYLNHRPIEIVQYVFNGFGFEALSRQTMSYTSFGALEQTLDFAWDFEAEDWLLANKTNYEYDSQQRVSAKETESFEEQGASYTLATYEYIDGEDLALETAYFKPDAQSAWILDTRTYYYYDAITAVPHIPVSQLALRVFPNPATGLVVAQLEAEADVQLYDAAGQLQRSFRLLPGQAIDLSGLPAGLYLIMAHSQSSLYQGKVVKQ